MHLRNRIWIRIYILTRYNIFSETFCIIWWRFPIFLLFCCCSKLIILFFIFLFWNFTYSNKIHNTTWCLHSSNKLLNDIFLKVIWSICLFRFLPVVTSHTMLRCFVRLISLRDFQKNSGKSEFIHYSWPFCFESPIYKSLIFYSILNLNILFLLLPTDH